MELGHAARDCVEALLQRRSDVPASITIERAGALIIDQRDADHLAGGRHAVEIQAIDSSVARIGAEMQTQFPVRARRCE